MQELKRRLQATQDLLPRWECAGETVTEELLWRWLKSKGDVDVAEGCLLEHAQWRIDLGPISEARQILSKHEFKSEWDLERRNAFRLHRGLSGRPHACNAPPMLLLLLLLLLDLLLIENLQAFQSLGKKELKVCGWTAYELLLHSQFDSEIVDRISHRLGEIFLLWQAAKSNLLDTNKLLRSAGRHQD